MNRLVPSTPAQSFTCPFCPLLCDGYTVEVSGHAPPELRGSDCARARAALRTFGDPHDAPAPMVDRADATLDGAIEAAAQLLAASRQPLFGGLGADVAGARVLYRLACDTGAICDAAQGHALMHGLRTLQDRGQFTTTLAEVRERADLLLCIGGSPAQAFPEFFRRCGIGERREDGTVLDRHVVLLVEAGPGPDGPAPALPPGMSLETLVLPGDLHDGVARLAALVAGRALRDTPAPLAALARRLREARYAVLAWQGGRLPAHGALVVEAIGRIVNTLNRHTRAATLPLGGGDGAATVNQVFAWLSGLPLRSRAGPDGLEHEPVTFDAHRLLARSAVDSLLWVHAFDANAAPPASGLPSIVIGHPGLARHLPKDAARRTVFIPVATPGVGAAGHLFRTDGVVLLPLRAVRPDGLPSIAEVLTRLHEALRRVKGVPG